MLRKSHLDHWNKTTANTGTGRPVDAIISPAVAYTAVPHGLNTLVFGCSLVISFLDDLPLLEIRSTRHCAMRWTTLLLHSR